MEGMEAAIGVSSGMAAIACTLDQLLPEGGHIISSNTVYGGTYALFKNYFPKRNIEVTFVNIEDSAQINAALKKNTKVIYTETLSNPLLRLSDLPQISTFAKKHGLTFVVDNTFTPLIFTPSTYGADIVIHSCTKYISGSSDLIAGAIASNKKFIDALVDINHGAIMLTGPVMDPRVAHELYLRLDHLPIRMKAHSEMTFYLAENFKNHGIDVTYPGLKEHVHHNKMKELMNVEFGFGGMMTVDCKTPDNAMKLAQKLQDEKFGLYAVSLGFSRTLMSCPSVSTSSEIPADEQIKMNLSPGLLRLSIGYLGNQTTMLNRFLKCYREIFK